MIETFYFRCFERQSLYSMTEETVIYSYHNFPAVLRELKKKEDQFLCDYKNYLTKVSLYELVDKL